MAQPVNNLIFDSTVAADGEWRNVSNFIAVSVYLTGTESNVWIEGSNDPSIVGDTPRSPRCRDIFNILTPGMKYPMPL